MELYMSNKRNTSAKAPFNIPIRVANESQNPMVQNLAYMQDFFSRVAQIAYKNVDDLIQLQKKDTQNTLFLTQKALWSAVENDAAFLAKGASIAKAQALQEEQHLKQNENAQSSLKLFNTNQKNDQDRSLEQLQRNLQVELNDPVYVRAFQQLLDRFKNPGSVYSSGNETETEDDEADNRMLGIMDRMTKFYRDEESRAKKAKPHQVSWLVLMGLLPALFDWNNPLVILFRQTRLNNKKQVEPQNNRES